MNKTIFLAITLLFTLNAHAQESDYSLERLSWLIKKGYRIWEFHEGLALIEYNGKYGYVNKLGEIIVPPSYVYVFGSISRFWEGGLAAVWNDEGKMGVIDSTGKLVFPFQYNELKYDKTHGYVLLLIYDKENYNSYLEYNRYQTYANYTRVDCAMKNGDIIKSFNNISIGEFKDGILVSPNQIYNIPQNKITKIQEGYIYSADITNGVFCVEKVIETTKGRITKQGVVDINGIEIIPLKKWLVSRLSDDIRDKVDDYFIVSTEDSVSAGEQAIFDLKGKQLSPFMNYSFDYGFLDGIGIIEEDYEYYYIDVTGKKLFNRGFSDARLFHEGLASVGLKEDWNRIIHGYINKTGKIVIPLSYDEASDFVEGLARVKMGSKWGYIDKTGNKVVALKYDEVFDFVEGLAKVRIGDKYGFIDKKGNIVVPIKYDKVDDFVEGLAKVRIGNKYGFIDKKGNIVVPIKYDKADDFVEGLAKVRIGDKMGFVDKGGNSTFDY